MAKMSFNEFKKAWYRDTFMEGAFGLDQDFDAYVDDPTTGDDELYDFEIFGYMFPVFNTDEDIENYLMEEITGEDK